MPPRVLVPGVVRSLNARPRPSSRLGDDDARCAPAFPQLPSRNAIPRTDCIFWSNRCAENGEGLQILQYQIGQKYEVGKLPVEVTKVLHVLYFQHMAICRHLSLNLAL
jgi:hypothetical protein